MSEVPKLVTWDAPENLGKVPDSDWMCPVENTAMLSLYEMLGGEADDAAIRQWAGGRPQHLELLRYPEGYHTLQVIDSETGKALFSEDASRRYVSYTQYLEDCNLRFGHHYKPGTCFVLDAEAGTQINLDEGRCMTSFAIYGGTAHVAVYPRATDESESAADARFYGNLTLQPQAEVMMASLWGKAGSFDGTVGMSIFEHKGYDTNSTILVSANDPTSHYESAILRLDGHGQVTAVEGDYNGQKFLRQLGADPSKVDWTKTGRGTVTDPEDQRRAAGSIAEIFGLGRNWEGIDLRLTAAGLYAALGQRLPDLNQIIAPYGTEQSTLVKPR